MNDILGREIKKGDFVLYLKRVNERTTSAIGLVLGTFGKYTNTSGNVDESVRVIGTEYNVITETWNLGVKPSFVLARKVYIVKDLPMEVRKRLRDSKKIFEGDYK